MEGGVADRDGGHAIDLDEAALDEIESKHVGDEIDGGGGVAQLTYHLANARYVAEGQGDVDGGDPVRAGKLGHILAMSDQVRRIDGVGEAVDAPEIEETE